MCTKHALTCCHSSSDAIAMTFRAFGEHHKVSAEGRLHSEQGCCAQRLHMDIDSK